MTPRPMAADARPQRRIFVHCRAIAQRAILRTARKVGGKRQQQHGIGDSNLDRAFDSDDLIAVLTAGEYEAGIKLNSTWATGDWNGDREFDSGDLVAAFTDGGYDAGSRAAVSIVPEPSCAILPGLGIVGLGRLRSRR